MTATDNPERAICDAITTGDVKTAVDLLLKHSRPELWKAAEAAAAQAPKSHRADTEHAVWIARRREGIGGSDVPTLLGLNARFTTPKQLWEIKTGRRPNDPSTPATERGHRLEPWVVEEAARLVGAEIDPAGVAFHKHPRWKDGVCIQANTDGTVTAPTSAPTLGPGLFEAKTSKMSQHSLSKAQSYLNYTVPASHMIQCQAYMAATGLEWGLIAAAIGPGDHDDWTPDNVLGFIVQSFKRHAPLQDALEHACVEFWECVQHDTPPTWKTHKNLAMIKNELLQVKSRVSKRPNGKPAIWWKGDT